MTNADKIRSLSNDELVKLLTWWEVREENLYIPGCEDGCENFGHGCAINCPIEIQERAVREWLEQEAD